MDKIWYCLNCNVAYGKAVDDWKHCRECGYDTLVNKTRQELVMDHAIRAVVKAIDERYQNNWPVIWGIIYWWGRFKDAYREKSEELAYLPYAFRLTDFLKLFHGVILPKAEALRRRREKRECKKIKQPRNRRPV